MLTEKTPEFGYQLAYRLAREQLAGITDLEGQCRKSGARCTVPGKVVVDYLNQPCLMTVPDGEVSPVAGGELSVREKLLVLHYFIRARGTPLSGKAMAYKELPEGLNYFPVFFKRAIKPLLDHFGGRPGQLLQVAAVLGGHKAEYGDVAVTIYAFPRVPVTLVLWKGDEEFPADGNVMFDSTISDYLSTDDINVLCETIAWRLVRLKEAR